MKIENIKNALKARASALNLNPQENKPPVVTAKPSVKADAAQSQPAGSGDKAKVPDKGAPTPTGNASNVSAEKPARKPATRKPKEIPAVQLDDIEEPTQYMLN